MKIPCVIGVILILSTTSTVTSEVSLCVHNDVELTMETATLEINNLGDEGPDFGEAPVMRFSDIGTYGGMTLDLVAKIKEDEFYEAANTDNNGLLCGIKDNGKPDTRSCTTGAYFAQINMRRNRESIVVFEIQDHETEELVTLPGFVFSVFDIDEGVKEHYVMTDWATAQYDHDNTEAYFTETDGLCEEHTDTNCIYAHSTHRGHGCDNPSDPMDLGVIQCKDRPVDQKARSFQVTYENKSSFELFFWYEASEGDNGRNFVFSFNSAHSDDCETLSPTVEPTKAPVPTRDDDEMCVEDL